MNFEIHTAAATDNGKCGIAIHTSCVHDDYASSRQMTFLYESDDILLGGLKAIEIAMSCIKNRCKTSPIIIYVQPEVWSVLESGIGTNHHKAKVKLIQDIQSTFPCIEIKSSPNSAAAIDARECVRSGRTKDTGTMVVE